MCALQYIAPDEHAEPQNRNVSICFGSPIGQRHMLGRSSINLTRTDAANGPELLRSFRLIMSLVAASRLLLTPPLPILAISIRNLFIGVTGAFASDQSPAATFSLHTNIILGPRVCE